MGSNDNSTVLNVGVLGAGIAGLGAAIGLCHAGHDVEVFEKSSFKNEIGAAISMTPNGNLILEKWHFDAKKARETDKCQFRKINPKTFECETTIDYTGVPEMYGHKFSAFHRVDMHDEMRRLALEAGAQVRLGREVVDVDCEHGILTFKDGKKVEKDLLVIADGIKSHFVEKVTGVPIPMRKTGKSVYRLLIPMDRLMQDPLIRPMYEGELSGFANAIDFETGIRFVTYPCREGTVMNIAIFHTTKPHQVDNEDWHSPATVEDVLEVLDGFHPAWKAMVKHADHINCYSVGHRDVSPCMANGKAGLIGDAAHPMLPTHAQGGCVSLEDAAALQVLFSNWKSSDSVEKRLQIFNQLRLPRDATTQLVSSGMFQFSKPTEDSLAPIRRFYHGPVLPPGSTSWIEPIREFFFPYNAFAEAEKALKYVHDPNGIPENVIKHFGR